MIFFQAPAIHVTFDLSAPSLPDSTTVYLTGSTDFLASWDPGKLKMESAGNHHWRMRIDLCQAISIEYKYTLGSWQREGAGASGSPLPNFSAKITGDTTLHDTISNWTQGQARQIQGQITGNVRYHRAMKGDGLRDRDVIVWLPPGYDKSKGERYPVLYMQDGENVFDPKTSFGGIDWQIDETADRLIREKKIRPLIVVGIYNTVDRASEYSPGGKSPAYMNFVVNKLKPFIDRTYRTKPDRRNTMTGGSSSGGIISFMLVWEHPDVFSKAICMSPAFATPEGSRHAYDYSKTVSTTPNPPLPVSFYIDIGGVGLESELRPGVDEMLAVLKQKHVKFDFVSDPSARHSEADWAKRFPEALIKVLH